MLLGDEKNAVAWKLRGMTYARMGVPHLAILHLKRAVEENQDDPTAITALRAADEAAIARAHCSREDHLAWERDRHKHELGPSTTDSANVAVHWHCAKRLKEEGVVVFLEEFFETASIKFEVADAFCCQTMAMDDGKQLNMAEALQFRIDCLSNMGSCYFKMSTIRTVKVAVELYTKALSLCEEKRKLSGESMRRGEAAASILYRRAQAYQFLYYFSLSLIDLKAANMICEDCESCLVDERGEEGRRELVRKIERYTSYIQHRIQAVGDL